MNRTEKAEAVESMAAAFAQAPHVFVTGYRGMTVNQASELRRRIRAAGGSYTVVKNRLARRASVDTPVGRVESKLRGPCALVSHRTDPVILAKVLSDFAKENDQKPSVKGGIYEGKSVDDAMVKKLATMPTRDEALSMALELARSK